MFWSALVVLMACSGDDDKTPATDALPTLAPPPEGEGFQMSMTGMAPAYSEVWLCNVYNLDTNEVAPVHQVEYLQNPGLHHMTLSTTALAGTVLENGTYDCADLYSDTEFMQDAVMMFGSQGNAEGTLTLPEGVAVSLPAGLQVVHEVHYVNTTDTDEEVYSYVNGWTIPPDEVVDGVWGGSVRDENIEIPPNSTHTEWSRCVMNADVQVQFLASHTHALASNFTIAPFDGQTTGDVIFSNDDWHDPKITQYTTPIQVPAGQGFEFSCTWNNTSSGTIRYGVNADDEMCNMAIVFTPFNMNAACEVVETSDGVLP